MKTIHINNCISMIKRKMREKHENEAPISVGEITSPEWCAWFGEGYLESFRTELNRRGKLNIDI